MKPTKEQEQKFWEHWGFVNKDDRLIEKGKLHLWQTPDKKEYVYDLPPIDLNNLFKYAVPKLKELYKRREIEYATLCVTLENWLDIVEDTDEDPALALFWAIFKVMESQA